MTAADILKRATADGVRLTLTPAGTIKAMGAQSAVERWRDTLRDNRDGIILALRQIDATPSRWWRLHYADSDPVDLICVPVATHAEMLARHPDALAAEPYTPIWRAPAAPMTEVQKGELRGWLALIGEHDPEWIDGVIEHCQRDADSRDYFLARAYRKSLH